MRRSKFYMPTLKETPADAQVPSHQLMLRAGMIKQVTSGIYTWLPLGLRVMQNVEKIIRQEMNRAGAQELFMPMFQPAELWQETGRWDKMEAGLMLKLKDRHDRAACLGPTHEEIITDLYRSTVKSYRDLPLMMYQIQTKFRDEIRPRFGALRAREFMMKDCYSFAENEDQAKECYEAMRMAYHKIFNRLGLEFRQVMADSGDIGGNHSHEFHVLAETGEDDLLFDPKGDYAVNVEKHDPKTCPVDEEALLKKKGIEVGHIFLLGEAYSRPMKATVRKADGSDVPVIMGCYGIGVSRVVAAAIEQHHDDAGIKWPHTLAPFEIGLINLRPGDELTTEVCEQIYDGFTFQGHDVLYDDRDEPAGVKFAEMDLIGLPWQCIVGPKGVQKGKVEWKNRTTGERLELPPGRLPDDLANARTAVDAEEAA